MANRIHAEIRPRCTRLEYAGKFGIEGSDCEANEEAVLRSDFPKEFGVAENEVRFRHDADAESTVKGEFFEDCSSDFVAALGRLVGIGRGADRNAL